MLIPKVSESCIRNIPFLLRTIRGITTTTSKKHVQALYIPGYSNTVQWPGKPFSTPPQIWSSQHAHHYNGYFEIWTDHTLEIENPGKVFKYVAWLEISTCMTTTTNQVTKSYTFLEQNYRWWIAWTELFGKHWHTNAEILRLLVHKPLKKLAHVHK